MHDQHFEKLLRLIDIEREAEKEENKRELEKYPLHVREALGKTATHLVIDDEDVGVGGLPLLILSHNSKGKVRSHLEELSPFHAMNQGDNVLLTFPSTSNLKPIDGTLY